MPYYGYGYYSYGEFLANNLYFLLLIPVLLLSIWAQIQVSGSFRRYSQAATTDAASPAPRRRRRCCGPTGSTTCPSGPAGAI